MEKVQKIKFLLGRLFRVKTAVILWIVHTILSGISLSFLYTIDNSTMMDLFGGLSWIVSIVAYVSSVGAVIRTFINKELAFKRKILATILIVVVYFGTSGILYLAFNNAAKEAEAEMERMLESEGYKTEIEAGDWSEWTTEEDDDTTLFP